MEDNNSLDSFLTNNMQDNSGAPTANTETPQTIQKPKLRKIKRAKIRSATPVSPIMEEQSTPILQENSSDLTIQSEINATEEVSAPAQTDFSDTANESPIVSDLETESATKTELVTASDAQEMTAEPYQDSYILEGLPPELDYETDENYEAIYEGDTGYIKKSIFYTVTTICLLFGLFIGKALFSSQIVENHGLEGVVTNPDVPQGRPRCGLTDKSQACIFYMMNWYKQELNGRDFYKLAAQLTGREEYMIETDNLRYATVKIRPGHFAQLNIPALKE